MAISGFGRGKGGAGTGSGTNVASTSPAASGSSASSSSGLGNLTAFIDQGSEFEGKLSFKDTVRIDGSFSGEIASENTLVVGETGEIDANIESQTVIISGTVTGDVKANQKIVLHKTAVVQGNLTATTFVVEEGASFNGQISMGKGATATPIKAVKDGDNKN